MKVKIESVETWRNLTKILFYSTLKILKFFFNFVNFTHRKNILEFKDITKINGLFLFELNERNLIIFI